MISVKSINIKTIPHDQHRYPTVGDWWVGDDETLEIRVSECGDWRASMSVAIHEAVEALTCIENGVEPESLDRFDKAYEILRLGQHDEGSNHEGMPGAGTCAYCKAKANLMHEFGGHDEITEDSEPGEDTHAPYRHQHALATQVEWILSEGLHLPWKLYEEELSSLYEDEK